MPLAMNIGEGSPGRVCVYGGPLRGDICMTSDASVIAFYDRFGDLTSVIHRIISDDIWGIVTKNDDDWDATLARLGIINTTPVDISG